MSVCVATMGMYWQPAIPGGGPGGYTVGNDRPSIAQKISKRLNVSIRLVNICESEKLELEVSPLKVTL